MVSSNRGHCWKEQSRVTVWLVENAVPWADILLQKSAGMCESGYIHTINKLNWVFDILEIMIAWQNKSVNLITYSTSLSSIKTSKQCMLRQKDYSTYEYINNSKT